MKQRSIFLAVSIMVVLVVAAFASGFASGAGRGLYRLVGLFGQVVQLVGANYVEDVPVEKLELGALGGMVEAADPGGAYVPDGSVADYERVLARTLPPFGLVLGKRSSYPAVLQVVEGSPAAKAGLVPGELVERIGSEPVRARPLWRALVLLDAAERRGGTVNLDVIDRQLAGKRLVTLAAAQLAPPSLAVELRSGVPVARIPVLGVEAAKQLANAMRPHRGVPAVVLDLRGVALGSANGALAVAEELAGGEVRLRLAKRDGKPEIVRLSGAQRPWKVIVCLDATTAGAAELLAAALKERGATLVGGESYGDTGQRRPHGGAGGQVWLASSWALGPDGKPLLGAGLKPDEVVRARKGTDAVLERALELAGDHAEKKAA